MGQQSLVGMIFLPLNSRCVTTVVGYDAKCDDYWIQRDGQIGVESMARSKFEEDFEAGAIRLAYPMWSPYCRPPGSKSGGLVVPANLSQWPASC